MAKVGKAGLYDCRGRGLEHGKLTVCDSSRPCVATTVPFAGLVGHHDDLNVVLDHLVSERLS